MVDWIRTRCAATGRFLTEKSISQKELSRACIVLLVAMLIPLIWIAVYNYPADDDFASALPMATAWLNTGSLTEVAKAVYEKTVNHYMSWNGNIVSAVFCVITPMIFSIDLYFLSNWFILALVCLSIGYLLKAVMATLGASSKSVFWICYTAILILALQFMPSIGDSVYWHTGGMYLVASCTLMQTVGLLLHCGMHQSKKRAVWRGALLFLCGFMLGGSFYGPMLGSFVMLALISVGGFLRRSRIRLPALLTIVGFAISMGISFAAPGNLQRQEMLGQPMSVFDALLTAVLDSFDLIGGWITPQLFAMLAIILPVLWIPLKESHLRFKHPFCFLILLFGAFSATLFPGLYTGASYGMGRYMNVIYMNFLMLAFGSVIYTMGWFIRLLQQQKDGTRAARLLTFMADAGKRFSVLYIVAVLGFLALGGFAFTIMNTSTVNATKALALGEAVRFHEDMKEREEYIRITDSDEVVVEALQSQPFVFKADKLPFQGIYGRVRYMKWYFELFHDAQALQ